MYVGHVFATARNAFECAQNSRGCFSSGSIAASTLERFVPVARAANTFSAVVRARVFVGQPVDELALLHARRLSALALTIVAPAIAP